MTLFDSESLKSTVSSSLDSSWFRLEDEETKYDGGPPRDSYRVEGFRGTPCTRGRGREGKKERLLLFPYLMTTCLIESSTQSFCTRTGIKFGQKGL